MSTVRCKPLLHHPPSKNPRFPLHRLTGPIFSSSIPRRSSGSLSSSGPPRSRVLPVARSSLASPQSPPLAEESGILFSETFQLKRIESEEGRISVRLDRKEEGGSKWKLIVGCDLDGEWILHWGVTYADDFGSEWDQPPPEMRPPGSVTIKDYAIETPLKKSSSVLNGKILHEVQIDFDISSTIAAIHFVLKEEKTGAWFQHKGRDFRIPLTKSLEEKEDTVRGKRSFSIWPGGLDLISSILLNPEGSRSEVEDSKDTMQQSPGFYEEFSISKEHFVQNSMTVVVKKSEETNKNLVHIDTDVPGDVVVHWGVCRENSKQWEVPSTPHPPPTTVFRRKALRTLLQPKADGRGNWGLLHVDREFSAVLFVLKLSEYVWLNNLGTDFYVPLVSEKSEAILPESPKSTGETNQVHGAYTDEIISGIRNLTTGIASERGKGANNKEGRENILQEIEKLAAEAYKIFRSSVPTFVEESIPDAEQLKPAVKVCSGTGSGYEILCQGFNWESHKSGRWYTDLSSKASELSSLGFTTVWLPPPTESVSPEGYMPKDLYNLNSRYGSMEELKALVKRFHEVGIKVLGDAVLNHRCAHYQNKNGIWNVFGGRLNWDERAVVADDPHFQGRGNKSSGDSFHAAPNIDHSQDFVRKDLKGWLCWLREEVGYDGWRLDFVRGFWGGYVKDYMEATEPYFAVGEYWDSLSYTYGAMDHNQDAHRQRIIDWINATNGTCGAFDVTTKGILHAALEKCEYWRLSDEKGKPPGVLGWWPSRAVTFIENHDTGSTQGHWRFPSGKEMQGYAYILTHPGTPAVFYDHVFSRYQQEISKLIALRQRTKINCRSVVKITKTERDVYAAEIDEKVAVKIGPGFYEPANGPKKWKLAAEGKDYKAWEAS